MLVGYFQKQEGNATWKFVRFHTFLTGTCELQTVINMEMLTYVQLDLEMFEKEKFQFCQKHLNQRSTNRLFNTTH